MLSTSAGHSPSKEKGNDTTPSLDSNTESPDKDSGWEEFELPYDCDAISTLSAKVTSLATQIEELRALIPSIETIKTQTALAQNKLTAENINATSVRCDDLAFHLSVAQLQLAAKLDYATYNANLTHVLTRIVAMENVLMTREYTGRFAVSDCEAWHMISGLHQGEKSQSHALRRKAPNTLLSPALRVTYRKILDRGLSLESSGAIEKWFAEKRDFLAVAELSGHGNEFFELVKSKFPVAAASFEPTEASLCAVYEEFAEYVVRRVIEKAWRLRLCANKLTSETFASRGQFRPFMILYLGFVQHAYKVLSPRQFRDLFLEMFRDVRSLNNEALGERVYQMELELNRLVMSPPSRDTKEMPRLVHVLSSSVEFELQEHYNRVQEKRAKEASGSKAQLVESREPETLSEVIER